MKCISSEEHDFTVNPPVHTHPIPSNSHLQNCKITPAWNTGTACNASACWTWLFQTTLYDRLSEQQLRFELFPNYQRVIDDDDRNHAAECRPRESGLGCLRPYRLYWLSGVFSANKQAKIETASAAQRFLVAAGASYEWHVWAGFTCST